MALKRMWRFGMTSFPAPELDHIKYVCMVDTTRARSVLGFEPKHDLASTVDAVFAGE
jgi:UDP-glucose 4-epimerase